MCGGNICTETDVPLNVFGSVPAKKWTSYEGGHDIWACISCNVSRDSFQCAQAQAHVCDLDLPYLQRFVFCVTLVTNVADKLGSLVDVFMRLDMLPKGGVECECFVTLCARMWTLIAVDSCMLLQFTYLAR